MIKILIISDSNKHFDIAIKEYEKRLGKNIEIIRIKPIKIWTDKQIIDKETDNLINKLQKISWYKIVLNPEWKSFNTKDFFKFVEEKKYLYKNIIFIIGWALGLNYQKLKNYINFELNLWKFTLPHSLALLVLIEQIYRLEMIKKQTAYNK